MGGPKFLIDANLIVLLAVGLADVRWIAGHKRLKGYGPEDFVILQNLLSRATQITSLPNAWTEASNLLGQGGSNFQITKILSQFQFLIIDFGCAYVPGATEVARSEFKFLGLTDCALLELAGLDFTILSADHKLCIAAEKAGLKASNFNHFRGL